MSNAIKSKLVYGALCIMNAAAIAMQEGHDALMDMMYQEDLVEMCCDPESELTKEAIRKGLRARRLTASTGYDFSKRGLGARLEVEFKQKKTR